MIPPHLPPPSSNIVHHKKWQQIKLILLVSFLGLFAGVVGASVMLGWIWPMSGEADRFTALYYRSRVVYRQLELQILEEVKSKIASIYNITPLTDKVDIVNSKEKIGEAFVVSSDGWLALYIPEYKDNFKNWQVITNEGKIVALEKAVYDSYTNILFLKVSTDALQNFSKQMEFVERAQAGDDVFVYENGFWNYSTIAQEQQMNVVVPHLDSLSSKQYILTEDFSSGSVVITPQGRMIGVVVKNKHILPSVAITDRLSTVLSQGKIAYPSLGVEGWFNTEVPIVVKENRTSGFYVENIISKQSVLKRGDIILLINNEVVDPTTMWYTVRNNTEVTMSILRAGKVISIHASILIL